VVANDASSVTAYPVFTKKKSVDICEAFIDGLPIERGLQGNVFYGVTEVNMKSWSLAKTKAPDYPYYYIDNSYFDRTRGTHYRVSKNSLQFQGPNYESNGKRWEALGYELKPWRDPEQGHIVVCPQSQTFLRYTVAGRNWATIARMWLPDTLDMLKKAWLKREIRVREWAADKQTATLQEDLKGAGLLVTHSSAAAIEAVIEGVQVLFSSKSPSALATMAMASDNASDQRLKYLRALADNQWTLEAIDWNTGKSAFHFILGGARFNSFYSQPQVDMDGRVLVSGLYGAVRIQPKAGVR